MRYILVLMVLFFIGCGSPMDEREHQARVNTLHNPVVNIESCEYIVSNVHGGTVYSHKGNCKNPIHKVEIQTVTMDERAINELRKTRHDLNEETSKQMDALAEVDKKVAAQKRLLSENKKTIAEQERLIELQRARLNQ